MKGSSLILTCFVYNYPCMQSSRLIFNKQNRLSEPHQAANVACCVPPRPSLFNLKNL